MPDQHRKSVGYDVDSEVLRAAEPDVLLTFASQVLNAKFDISESGDVEAAAVVFKDGRETLLAKKKATVWETPPGLDATQVVPCRILYFISALYEDYILYEMCGQHLLSM